VLFRAHVLADNNRVLAMLSRLTDIQQRQIEQGVVDGLFSLSNTRPAGVLKAALHQNL
jgi:hypothetical protein